MEITVILAHPRKGSFNHSIAEFTVKTLMYHGYRVNFHDLYEEKFDPILQHEEIFNEVPSEPIILTHCNEITRAEGIIIVHPDWWGQPPAILKGWIDRVIRAGVAYEFAEGGGGEGIPIGLLKAKAALVFNTSNTPRERELSVFGDPLEMLWKNCVFQLCGVQHFYRRMFGVIVTSSMEQRQSWLTEVRETVTHYFPNQ